MDSENELVLYTSASQSDNSSRPTSRLAIVPHPGDANEISQTSDMEISDGRFKYSRKIKGHLSPRTNARSTPTALPTALLLKQQTQQHRILELEDILEGLKSDTTFALNLLDAILETVMDIHHQFNEVHEYLEENWPAEFIDHSYFKDGWYQKKSRLVRRIQQRVIILKAACTPSHSEPQPATHQLTPKLPKLNIPVFKGDYALWRPFKELFTRRVIDDDRVSPAGKLVYLREQLDGDPAFMISRLPAGGDSFQAAWDMLVKEYENPRYLIEHQLTRLLQAPPDTPLKTSRQLADFVDTITEAVKALHSLGPPELLWEWIAVHINVHHLDKASRELWETSLGRSNTHPTFEQFREFIITRANTLGQVKKSEAPKPIRARRSAHPRVTSSSPFSYECDCCTEMHFIVSCEKFRKLSVKERRRVVITKRLCYNCLGRHNVSSCRTAEECKKCRAKHHTMLH